MNEIPRIAVIPTHNRPAELERCLRAIGPQCNAVIVIDNASTPPVSEQHAYVAARFDAGWVGGKPPFVTVLRDAEQPPNLSRLWNRGLAAAEEWAWTDAVEPEAFDVAVLNDDAVPPPGWWDAVSAAMRAHGAAAGSSDPLDQYGSGVTVVHGADAPMSVATRLAGWAFILRGELGLRADERLRWWAGDDDLSYRARQLGGIVHVGGFPVENTSANKSTVGDLAEQATRDMAMFVEIHGRRPW